MKLSSCARKLLVLLKPFWLLKNALANFREKYSHPSVDEAPFQNKKFLPPFLRLLGLAPGPGLEPQAKISSLLLIKSIAQPRLDRLSYLDNLECSKMAITYFRQLLSLLCVFSQMVSFLLLLLLNF